MNDFVVRVLLELAAIPMRLLFGAVRVAYRLVRPRHLALTTMCKVCLTEVPLVGISACVCGRVEAGSVLRCSCGARFTTTTCPTCGVTIDIK